MHRFARYSTLLVVLLLLTGCSGFLGSGQDSSEVSVTPVDIPTDNPSVAPRGQIAPGVSSTGVYNTSALAYTHARILGNTSFTIRMNLTQHYLNGTQMRQTTGIRRIESGPPVLVQSHYRSSPQQSEIRHRNRSGPLVRDRWHGPDNMYMRITYANNTTTYNVIPQHLHRNNAYDFTYFQTINQSLSSDDTRISRLTRNGSTYYRIEGTIPREYTSTSRSNKRNSSYRTLIDSRGVIHEYQHTVISSGPNETAVHIHFNISFRKIGNTTVRQPSWVETARNRTEPTNRTTTVRSRNDQSIETV